MMANHMQAEPETGEAMVFLMVKRFFSFPSLKLQIFLRPDQNQTIFINCPTRTVDFFTIYFSFDFQCTILSSRCVTTFYLDFASLFLIIKAVVWNK